MQCCQVAEIQAKKLKRGREKKLTWRICGRILLKEAEKGAEEKSSSEFYSNQTLRDKDKL
jgi:hypothetical protein